VEPGILDPSVRSGYHGIAPARPGFSGLSVCMRSIPLNATLSKSANLLLVLGIPSMLLLALSLYLGFGWKAETGPISSRSQVRRHLDDGQIITVVGAAIKDFKYGPKLLLGDYSHFRITNQPELAPWPDGIQEGMRVRVEGKIITVDELGRWYVPGGACVPERYVTEIEMISMKPEE